MLSRFAATSTPEPPPLRTSFDGFRRRRVWKTSSVSSSFTGIPTRTPPANQKTLPGPAKRKAPVKKAAFKSLPAQRKKLSAAAPRKNLRTPATSGKAVPSKVADLQGSLRGTPDGQTRTHAPPILLRSDPGTSHDRPSTSAESSSNIPRWPASSPPQMSSLAEVEFGMASEAAMELQSADASSFGVQRAGLAALAMPNTSSYTSVAGAASVPPSLPAQVSIHQDPQPQASAEQGSRLLQELGNIFKTLINSPSAANTQTSTGIHENSYKDVFVCQATPLAKEFLKSDHKKDTEEERRRPVARTFTNWLQAFCIYSNLLCEKFPNLGPGLFKHLDIILEAYRSYGGVAWFLYDDRVRQKMAVHKSMLWGSKDIDLGMGMLAPKPQSLQNQTKNVATYSFQSASGRHRSRKFRLPEFSVEFNSNKLEEFISQSLSKKTWRDYLNTWQNWLNHKANREGVNGDLDHLILLMLEHVEAQHSVAYVKKQLAGISFFLRLFGQVDVTKAAVVKQFLKGWHKGKFVADKRKPITLDLLHKLLLVSESVCLSDYEATLFKLLFLLMFFAALRVSEAVRASKLKHGIRSAVWNDLWQLFSLMLHKWGTPDIVIIHLGGNDIGKAKIWDLSRQIKRDLAVLHFNLPQAIIVWSEMVSRLPWLQQPNLKALERCKKKLNFGICKFMKSLNLLTYRHEELELDISNDIFNVGLQNAIEKAMFKWECAQCRTGMPGAHQKTLDLGPTGKPFALSQGNVETRLGVHHGADSLKGELSTATASHTSHDFARCKFTTTTPLRISRTTYQSGSPPYVLRALHLTPLGISVVPPPSFSERATTDFHLGLGCPHCPDYHFSLSVADPRLLSLLLLGGVPATLSNFALTGYGT
ncbi:hypothetical protein XELAEV_18029974mg [Xenopus laevis]|uniref:Uncharacterized protein n=1 Tax=Xenopus laevis TaxID=8355 RepID=A0A974CSG6_XENLA|nr:hypothetical protein XELAEV_18029974mg [Xenopus laevis]